MGGRDSRDWDEAALRRLAKAWHDELTLAQMAERFGCHISTITKKLAKLRKAGVLPPSAPVHSGPGARRRGQPSAAPSPVGKCIRAIGGGFLGGWRGVSIVKRQWTYDCGSSEQCVYEHTDEAVTIFVPRAPGPSRICDGADDCGGDCETVPVHVRANSLGITPTKG